MSQHIRRRVIYRGRVQGVGFRAAVRGIASGQRVAGYVRNQSDGTVEMVIDGSVGDVEQCLTAIRDRFAGNIEHVDDTPISEDGKTFSGFTIRW